MLARLCYAEIIGMVAIQGGLQQLCKTCSTPKRFGSTSETATDSRAPLSCGKEFRIDSKKSDF